MSGINMKTLLFVLTVSVTGCASTPPPMKSACERHPAVCAVGAALVAGSIAASITMRRHEATPYARQWSTQPIRAPQ